jgi:hemoglobin
VDWSVHIPKLIDYRCRVLLGEPGCDGYILNAHQEVHQVERFRTELFGPLVSALCRDRRQRLARADRRAAKAHAARIAAALARRLLDVDLQVAFNVGARG